MCSLQEHIDREIRARAAAILDDAAKKRGWNCDETDCSKTVKDGPLFRVNPKGQPGIFMCKEHEADTWKAQP